ncbi:UDP-glycosyltransferase UGT5-like [Athalia rosae]|uniref:UDP-glycosyltransferase UGT5-like n=1 Tax=Athalia rosae TaxID=37344 RepID=UPI00203496D4|nr:UDP-glycosyltransferase UGT5-like [Athalia rosae]
MRRVLSQYAYFCVSRCAKDTVQRFLASCRFPGKSHLPITSSVLHSLVKKGHDVTAFVPRSTGFTAANYKEINYNGTPIADNVDVMQFITENYFTRRLRFYEMGTLTTERALDTSEARNLIRSEEKYDVIVMEEFLNEAFYVFAHKFKCPVVLVHSFGATSMLVTEQHFLSADERLRRVSGPANHDRGPDSQCDNESLNRYKVQG